MWLEEEKEFLSELGKKINKFIDKEFEKIGWDRAYFEFKITANILNENFQRKIGEVTILDDGDKFYCVFCRRETYYHYGIDMPVCAECYAKLRGGENK